MTASASTRPEQSEGLGLHNLKRRAQLLGGAVDIEKREPAGMTHKITIPATSPSDE